MKLVYNPMKIFFLKKTWNTISTIIKYWKIKLINKTKKTILVSWRVKLKKEEEAKTNA
jgi:hypothetical protein